MAADQVSRPSLGGASSSPPDPQPPKPAPLLRTFRLRRRSEEGEDNSRKWIQIGLILLAAGLWWAVSGYLKHFTAGGNYEQGLALQKERKCADAIGKLDRALSYDPDLLQAYHARAICHARLSRFDQALADFNATVRLKPDYAAGHEGRGAMHRQKGNLDAALADWDTAIRLDPARSYARRWRAEVLRERDDVDRALVEYDGLIARGANDRAARMGRAALLRDKGDHDGALAEYGIVQSLGSETGAGGDEATRAFFERVATLRERGEIEAALTEAEKGIARWPEVATGYHERALIALFHTDKPAAAAADFAVALEKGYQYRRAMLLWAAGGEALGIAVTDHGWKLAPDTPFVPGIYHLVIQGHLARVRAGTADPNKLVKDVEWLGGELLPGLFREVNFFAWPGPLLKLFLGTMTPDEVRAAALAPGRDARHRACAADFHLAMYHQEKRQDADARRLLQAAADGCPVWAAERGFARAELKRLGS